MKFSLAVAAFGFLVAGSAFGQSVISAHSGVVQYVEGSAYLDNSPLDLKFGHYPEIKQDQEFRTEEGRAEILLTPGVFLRLGENSGIRMLSNGLADTRVEVLQGSAIVECDQLPKDNAITLVYKDATISLLKHGLYRVDTETARLQVYDGEASVAKDSGQLTLKAGKQTTLDGALLAQSFDKNSGDELYRWANRRAGYVAQANVSAASAFNSGGYGSGYGDLGYGGYGYGGYGYGFAGPGLLGGWNWNPLFGMFTYVPFSGVGYSPFGYALFSPSTVFSSPLYNNGLLGARSPALVRSSSIGARSGLAAASYGASARSAAFSSPSLSAGRSAGGFGGGHAGGHR